MRALVAHHHCHRSIVSIGKDLALGGVGLTQSSDTGTVWGLRGHNLPREGECREVRKGKTGRARALSCERPMGTATCGGKGFTERTRVSGERPIGAASLRQQPMQAS